MRLHPFGALVALPDPPILHPIQCRLHGYTLPACRDPPPLSPP